MRQVFISYKHEQDSLVQPLKTRLEDEGFNVWWDRDIHSGTEWRDKIDDEIRKSIALIVVMTPEAQASEYVTYEWSFAYGAGVRVIPLILIEPDKLHPRLSTLQRIRYDDAGHLDKIIASLKDAQSTYLTIHHAVWGARAKMNDVTRKLRDNISSGRLEMQAHKEVLGDIFRGELKKLIVVYSYGGKIDSEEVEENDYLSLPRDTGKLDED